MIGSGPNLQSIVLPALARYPASPQLMKARSEV